MYIERSYSDLRYYIDRVLFAAHHGDGYAPTDRCELCPSTHGDVGTVYIVPVNMAGLDAVTVHNVMLLCAPCRERVARMTPVEQAVASVMLTRRLPFDSGLLDAVYLVKNKSQRDLAPRDGDVCRVCEREYAAERPPHAGHLIAKRNLVNFARPDGLPHFLIHHAANFVRMCKPCNDVIGTRTPMLTPASLRLVLKPWADGKHLSANYLRDEKQFARRDIHRAHPRVHIKVSPIPPAGACPNYFLRRPAGHPTAA